ncbi:hypothetical protein SteCoe_14101 [Stentor coeruleus]|uniref:Globin family profile domain-containing protein n=1 Tax=Stentor coeruleus TaxID=5963 RepID=A0A1R2C6R4_9CILI|nr:hypothetical protein SteCoe_14101 [Stentor coeruleus]
MNIFQKYGGTEFWREFLSAFYSRIISSEKISHRFIGANIDHVKTMLVSMLEISLETDNGLAGEGLRESHKNMGLSDEEFDEWISIYSKTLKDLGVMKQDSDCIINSAENFRPYIVSKGSR